MSINFLIQPQRGTLRIDLGFSSYEFEKYFEHLCCIDSLKIKHYFKCFNFNLLRLIVLPSFLNRMLIRFSKTMRGFEKLLKPRQEKSTFLERLRVHFSRKMKLLHGLYLELQKNLNRGVRKCPVMSILSEKMPTVIVRVQQA